MYFSLKTYKTGFSYKIELEVIPIRPQFSQMPSPQHLKFNFLISIINGEVREITDYWNKKFEEANATFGKNGERVLAFANIYLKSNEYKRDSQFVMKEEEKNYPMEGLTFIGLMALNDPPRVYVDHSVSKWRIAGIKVIMVTGDQPVTAAAIAKKVNIITPGSRVNVDLIEEGMNEDQANEVCDAIVIHGDDLARRHAAEDNLEDSDPEKGRFILNWISKNEVVFARTTPSQKITYCWCMPKSRTCCCCNRRRSKWFTCY